MGSITLIRFIRPTMLILAFSLKCETLNRKSVGKLFFEKLCMISTVVKITCERFKNHTKCICGGSTCIECSALCRHSTKWGKSFTYIKPQQNTISILWYGVKKTMSHTTHYKKLLNIKCFILSFHYVTIWLHSWCYDVQCTDGLDPSASNYFPFFIWTSIKKNATKCLY